MRGDLATLTHVDGHFLSDSVNPADVLRISQGAFLRLPPGRWYRLAKGFLAEGGEDREGGGLMQEGLLPGELATGNNTAQLFILTPNPESHGSMEE
jgi:hypothetical protein